MELFRRVCLKVNKKQLAKRSRFGPLSAPMNSKHLTILLSGCLAATMLAGCRSMSSADSDSQPNTLTRAEKAAGWKLLFDGQSFAGWHNFKHDGVRPGWQVKDGELV